MFAAGGVQLDEVEWKYRFRTNHHYGRFAVAPATLKFADHPDEYRKGRVTMWRTGLMLHALPSTAL